VDTGHGERKLEIQFLQRRASYIKGTAFDRGREVTTHHISVGSMEEREHEELLGKSLQ
jgi:hypothetical protein